MEAASSEVFSQPSFLHPLCGEVNIQQNNVFSQTKGVGSYAASNNQDGNNVRVKRSIGPIQASGKGVKCSFLAITSNGPIQVGAPPERGPFWINEQKKSAVYLEPKDTDSGKTESGVAMCGEHCKDASVVVPIKKRRIQLDEILCPPSPPSHQGTDSSQPRSYSPSCPSLPLRSFSPVSPSPTPPFEFPSSASPILALQSAPLGSASPSSKSSQPPPKSGIFRDLSSASDGHVTIVGSPFNDETVKKNKNGHGLAQLPNPSLCIKDDHYRAEDEERGDKSEKDCLDSNMVGACFENCAREISMMSGTLHTHAALETVQAVLPTSSSDRSQSRLHWDLNMEMEAWERPTGQATGSEDEAIAESACMSASAHMHERKGHLESRDSVGIVKMQLDEPETDEHADPAVSEFRDMNCNRVESKEGMPKVLQDEHMEEAAQSNDHLPTGSHQLPDNSEAEKHFNHEESNSEDLGGGRATPSFEVDSDLKSEKAIEAFGGSEEVDGMQKRDVKAFFCSTQMLEPISKQQEDARAAGLASQDQMRKGSNHVEGPCKSVKDNFFHHGNGELCINPIERGSLSMSGGSHLGSGRGPYGGGVALVTGGSFVRKKQMKDGINTRSTYDFSHDKDRPGHFQRGSAMNFSGRGSAHIWTGIQADAQDRQVDWWHRATRGFSLHDRVANAAGMGAGKVESNGIVVAPDGNDTKNGSEVMAKNDNIRSMLGFYHSAGRPLERGSLFDDSKAGVNVSLRAGVGTRRKMSATCNAGMDVGGDSRQKVAGGSLQGPYYGNEGLRLRRGEFHPNLNSRPSRSFRPDSRVERQNMLPESIRVWRDPAPSKWSSDEREMHSGSRCFQQPLSRSHYPRTLPNVVHGSSLMDERDRQILAGARQSTSATATKSRERSSEFRRSKKDGEDMKTCGLQLKQNDHCKTDPRDADNHKR